jgi:hypothetical protein
LIMVVDRWRHYLQQSEFEIRTYQKALGFLCSQDLHSKLQRKVMAKLMGMRFKVVYKQRNDAPIMNASITW